MTESSRQLEPARSPLARLSRRRVAVALALILLFGAGLRVWYAMPRLNKSRFWDERYSLENVEKILETWSLRPARGYYPAPLQSWPQALTLAASQELGERTGVEAFRTVDERGRFTSMAYLLVRLVSVLYGTLALAILFLVGRRMFSAGIGLAAALALASTPWHISVSAKFKPDALLVLTVLLAFYWSLGAVRRDRRKDYLLAGLGIALAASAKLLGVLVAVPLGLGTLWLAVRERRRIAGLLLAAGSSVVTFFLMNPYGWSYVWYVNSLQADYAKRAEWQGMTRASMPEELGEYLIGPGVHGPVLGAVAVLGLLGLLLTAVRPRGLERARRVERGMLVVFPPLYAVAYLAATPYFKGNNLLPIVPFTGLAAVWLVVRSWQAVANRLGARPWITASAAALLAFALAWPGAIYIYRSLTPTTLDVAFRFLRRGVGSSGGRIVLVEEMKLGEPAWEKSEPFERSAITLFVDRLDELHEHRLARADGEVFPASRLDGEQRDFYRSRIERIPEGRVRTIQARWFELRGPDLVAIRHWRRAGTDWIDLEMEPCPATENLCVTGALPEMIVPPELVSLSVRIPAGVLGGGEPPATIRVAGSAVPLRIARTGRRVVLGFTERFSLARRGGEVRLETGYPRADDARIRLAVRQWGPEAEESASDGED